MHNDEFAEQVAADIYADDFDADADVFEPAPVELPESLRLLALVGDKEKSPYRKGGKWEYADQIEGRVFFITQTLTHPASGTLLFSEQQVNDAVSRSSMTQWAWILHDRDTITQEEIDSGNAPADAQVGDPKHEHIHVVVRRKSAATLGSIARAFGVPPSQVEKKPQSEEVFFDLVEYLTHENPNQRKKRGKALYDRSEVRTNVNDLWEKLDEHVAKRLLKQTGGINVFKAVNDGEMTLEDVRTQYPELYLKKGNLSHLQRLRGDYLSRATPPPSVINIYISGVGGVGKDLLARALARALSAHPERPFFKVGASNVPFENYDGEDVIIWEDCRVGDMINHLGSRGMLFRLLGPYRDSNDRITVNVKHSKTSLINAVNIITGPDGYVTFLDGLAGEYTDKFGNRFIAENKAQAYRRFPLIIPVSEGMFDILVNKGFLNGTREYFAYEHLMGFRQSLEQVRRRAELISDAQQRDEVVRTVEHQTIQPVLEQVKRLQLPAGETITVEQFLEEFSDAGTIDPRQEILDAAAAWQAQGLQLYTAYFGKARNEHPHWRELNNSRNDKTATLAVIENAFGCLDDATSRENALRFYHGTEAVTPALSPEYSQLITSILPDVSGWD